MIPLPLVCSILYSVGLTCPDLLFPIPIGMDSEKVGVLEVGEMVGLAFLRSNEADITRCKLVLPANGAICW